MEEINNEPAAINSKTAKMLQLLVSKNLVYEQKLVASQLLVHPINRCGLMINSFDAHCKGYMALQCGFDPGKLQDSYCMEISKDPLKRSSQLAENKKLVHDSEQRLAPMSGTERHLSLSCSHISQFVKAAICGSCQTQHEELQEVNNGLLTLEGLVAKFQDAAFERLAKEGWVWRVISSEVEEHCSWFPAMLQASLNTANSVSTTPTEIEVAMTMCYWYKKQRSMEQAMNFTKLTMPLQCIDTVSHYVMNFSGGDDMPLIHLLDSINKMYGSSLHLGTEFFDHITGMNFNDKECTFPFIRCACIAAQMHSPKSQDSIAKLLVRSDLDRLKAASAKQNLTAAEKLLAISWDTVKQAGLTSTKDGVSLMARNLIRTALWLTKKGDKGREGRTYANLTEIHEAFKQEVESMAGNNSAEVSSSSANADAPIKVLTLEDATSRKTIAATGHPWLKKGSFYSFTKTGDIYQFVEFDDNVVKFEKEDLHGQVTGVEIAHEELKYVKPTDKKVPKAVEESLVAKMMPCLSAILNQEMEKALVQAGILKNHHM